MTTRRRQSLRPTPSRWCLVEQLWPFKKLEKTKKKWPLTVAVVGARIAVASFGCFGDGVATAAVGAGVAIAQRRRVMQQFSDHKTLQTVAPATTHDTPGEAEIAQTQLALHVDKDVAVRLVSGCNNGGAHLDLTSRCTTPFS